jgi:signal transduction histidine kinase
MTAEAATWSERDLDHRFKAGEPHDELTGLAATFDRMLDRLASSLRREQRFTAELSHGWRTPAATGMGRCRYP